MYNSEIQFSDKATIILLMIQSKTHKKYLENEISEEISNKCNRKTTILPAKLTFFYILLQNTSKKVVKSI